MRFKLSSKYFLAIWLLVSIIILAGCSTPEPETVQVEVTKEVVITEIVVQTEVVEGETVEVTREVEKVVTATPEPVTEPTMDRDPKTLVFAFWSNPPEIDPASTGQHLAQIIIGNIYEGLVRYKPDNIDEYMPQLAESWESNEDATVWQFKIREGATFSDGTPVNAEAAKISLKRLMEIGLGNSYILYSFMNDPENQMVVVDEYTLEFRLENPAPLLIDALCSQYGPYIISPKAIEENEVDGDMAHGWLQTNAVGSGPYVLSEFTPNEQIVLTKNESWWGWDDEFHFEKILIKIIPEGSTRLALLEEGDIDGTEELAIDDWETALDNPDISGHMDPGFSITSITMGEYGPLADPRVRQALSYAFDYDGWINGVLSGFASRAEGPFAPGFKCQDPDVFMYETDLDKAKQLLEEAGVPEGTEIRYLSAEGVFASPAIILQSQLAKIGINLVIEEVDMNTKATMQWSDTPWPERPELIPTGWWPDYNDPTQYAWILFHSAAHPPSGANFGFWTNEEADQILDEAAQTLDQDRLCELYKRFQQIVTEEDPPRIYTHRELDQMWFRSDIKGYVSNPIYRPNLWFWTFTREGF